ncbi:hypothetical protein OUZ56_012794 [Daphnia magna]|uniref:Uncharacterized protein n=1 Tax=Daphnia magna TaxID=35525 RepID=A0ABQ9Z474_9CRUS|nr:hypothetical protein OUZ56_012794 [Daphnia magna]
MSGPSDYYGGQERYSWDPRAVARINRDQENRDFDGRMEGWDRRPRGRYDEYKFSERDRVPFWDQWGAGPSSILYHMTISSTVTVVQVEDSKISSTTKDREFREVSSRPSYVDEEIYDQVERPRAERAERRREERLEKPRAERVDQRKRKRRSEGEEEDVEVEEDVSDDGESEQKKAEYPERMPTDRSWLPKSSQKKKQKVKTKPVEVFPEHASQAGPSNVASGSDEPIFVSKEITEEISNWLVHGLLADESKAISKKFALGFEDKSFSIKPPKPDSIMSRRGKDRNRSRTVSAAEEALITKQIKIMDIAPPLINFYTKICSLGEGEVKVQAKSAAQAILQQWGRPFHPISQRRRRSVVSLVDPAFQYLLSSPSAYVSGKEAVELLFTDAFLQSMLKEATQDVTLANLSATREWARAGVRKTSHTDPSTRVLKPRRSEAIRYYPEERQRSDGRRERAAPAKY